MTPAEFRRLALALPNAAESSHMGAADFRVGGRIFATLASAKQGYGNLMLTPELQRDLVADAPDLFLPAAGGWGRMGITHIRLASASEDQLADALQLAFGLRLARNQKPTPRKSRAAASAGRPAKKKASARRRTP